MTCFRGKWVAPTHLQGVFVETIVKYPNNIKKKIIKPKAPVLCLYKIHHSQHLGRCETDTVWPVVKTTDKINIKPVHWQLAALCVQLYSPWSSLDSFRHCFCKRSVLFDETETPRWHLFILWKLLWDVVFLSEFSSGQKQNREKKMCLQN